MPVVTKAQSLSLDEALRIAQQRSRRLVTQGAAFPIMWGSGTRQNP